MEEFEKARYLVCEECEDKQCGDWWDGCAMRELDDRIEENAEEYGESERDEIGGYGAAEVVCENCDRSNLLCRDCKMWKFFANQGQELPR